MPNLEQILRIERCPHCNVDNPNMSKVAEFHTNDSEGQRQRLWRVYACSRCGGVVTAWAPGHGHGVHEMFPESKSVDDALPDRARAYLQQAMQSVHAPAGAVMLAASAVDAMLKHKSYTDGTLNTRINKAADHLITAEMAQWAHEVRLDANDQRHSDNSAELPTASDAQRAIEFVRALGQFLYVLPARVQRGLTDHKHTKAPNHALQRLRSLD